MAHEEIENKLFNLDSERTMISTFLFYKRFRAGYVGEVMLLIPKKRGEGFVKQPVHHSYERWMSDLPYDVCGLDGYLSIETDYVNSNERLKAFMDKYLPVFRKQFKATSYKILSSLDWFEIGKTHLNIDPTNLSNGGLIGGAISEGQNKRNI